MRCASLQIFTIGIDFIVRYCYIHTVKTFYRLKIMRRVDTYSMTDFPLSADHTIDHIERIGEKLQEFSSVIPAIWDGKECITRMKEEECRNWKQVEWGGFYAEHLFDTLGNHYGFHPGVDKHNNTTFDYLFDDIPLDLKVHCETNARGKPNRMSPLNDKNAIDLAIAEFGVLSFVIFSMNSKFDMDGSFKQWHDEYKDGVSAYVAHGKKINRRSRKRKTVMSLNHIDIYSFTPETKDLLKITRQGRNSNGKPRPLKYSLDSRLSPNMVIDFSFPS